MSRLPLLLACSMLALVALFPSGAALAQPAPEFKLGFKTLADQIPAIAGRPVENEHYADNGDSLQRTTTGLMAWRKADNWTAFTDGSMTWINGPNGVQERGNQERFKWEGVPDFEVAAPAVGQPSSDSVLSDYLLVSWYGTPRTGLMGVLGQYSGDDLAARLRRQANAYAPFTGKQVLPAYELIAVVAQGSPGADGMWRRREAGEIIDSMLVEARANGFKLILDVQVGRSTVQEELEYLRPWLEQPDVYVALDPEFDMWEGQAPGREIGHTVATEVNYTLMMLDRIIRDRNLPPKVLIVHQFTLNMLPDKRDIGRSPVVDLVLDMDGFGPQAVKLGSYRAVMEQGALEYAGIKLFYDHDSGLFSPEQVMELDPEPSVVIYQ